MLLNTKFFLQCASRQQRVVFNQLNNAMGRLHDNISKNQYSSVMKQVIYYVVLALLLTALGVFFYGLYTYEELMKKWDANRILTIVALIFFAVSLFFAFMVYGDVFSINPSAIGMDKPKVTKRILKSFLDAIPKSLHYQFNIYIKVLKLKNHTSSVMLLLSVLMCIFILSIACLSFCLAVKVGAFEAIGATNCLSNLGAKKEKMGLIIISLLLIFAWYISLKIFLYLNNDEIWSSMNDLYRNVVYTILGKRVINYKKKMKTISFVVSFLFFSIFFIAALCLISEYTEKNTITIFAIRNTAILSVIFFVILALCYALFGNSLIEWLYADAVHSRALNNAKSEIYSIIDVEKLAEEVQAESFQDNYNIGHIAFFGNLSYTNFFWTSYDKYIFETINGIHEGFSNFYSKAVKQGAILAGAYVREVHVTIYGPSGSGKTSLLNTPFALQGWTVNGQKALNKCVIHDSNIIYTVVHTALQRQEPSLLTLIHDLFPKIGKKIENNEELLDIFYKAMDSYCEINGIPLIDHDLSAIFRLSSGEKQRFYLFSARILFRLSQLFDIVDLDTVLAICGDESESGVPIAQLSPSWSATAGIDKRIINLIAEKHSDLFSSKLVEFPILYLSITHAPKAHLALLRNKLKSFYERYLQSSDFHLITSLETILIEISVDNEGLLMKDVQNGLKIDPLLSNLTDNMIDLSKIGDKTKNCLKLQGREFTYFDPVNNAIKKIVFKEINEDKVFNNRADLAYIERIKQKNIEKQKAMAKEKARLQAQAKKRLSKEEKERIARIKKAQAVSAKRRIAKAKLKNTSKKAVDNSSIKKTNSKNSSTKKRKINQSKIRKVIKKTNKGRSTVKNRPKRSKSPQKANNMRVANNKMSQRASSPRSAAGNKMPQRASGPRSAAGNKMSQRANMQQKRPQGKQNARPTKKTQPARARAGKNRARNNASSSRPYAAAAN